MNPSHPLIQEIAAQNISGFEGAMGAVFFVAALGLLVSCLALLGGLRVAVYFRRWTLVALNLVLLLIVAFPLAAGPGLIHAAYTHEVNQEAGDITDILHGDFNVNSLPQAAGMFQIQACTVVLGHRVALEGARDSFNLDGDQAARLQQLLVDSTAPADRAIAERLAAK